MIMVNAFYRLTLYCDQIRKGLLRIIFQYTFAVTKKRDVYLKDSQNNILRSYHVILICPRIQFYRWTRVGVNTKEKRQTMKFCSYSIQVGVD